MLTREDRRSFAGYAVQLRGGEGQAQLRWAQLICAAYLMQLFKGREIRGNGDGKEWN